MAFVVADRVRDTTSTTGTGTITLNGVAPTGYQTFGAAIGNANNTYYAITAGNQWEVGIGTYTASGTTLSRDTILASSNSGSAVNFSAGTKDVFVTYPAGKSVYQNTAGKVSSNLGVLLNRGTLTGGAETSESVRINPPTGSQVNGAGVDDAVTVGTVITTGTFDTAANQYFDTVMSIGTNFNGSITSRYNTALPIARFAIESKYRQSSSSPYMSEYHLASQLYPTDGGGLANEYRAISATIPFREADYDTTSAAVLVRAAVTNVADGVSGTPRVTFDLRTGVNDILLIPNGAQRAPGITFAQNGVYFTRQLNAAGSSYLSLPFFNSSNALSMGNAGTIVANAPAVTSSITSATAMLSMNAASGMAANGHMLYMAAGGAITGNLTAGYFAASVSGSLETTLINSTSTGRAGYRIRTAGGTSYFEFHDNTNARNMSFTYYPGSGGSLALDDSQQGGQFATKNAFTVDYATFQTRFGYALRLHNSTTAALPTAATAGAGALAYSTTTSTPLFSNGSAWVNPLDRANQTGTQTASTISDFAEAVDDEVSTLMTSLANEFRYVYDDSANNLALSRNTRGFFVFNEFFSTANDGVFTYAAVAGGTLAAIPNTILTIDHPGAQAFRSSASANSGFYSHTAITTGLRIGGGEIWTARFATTSSFTNIMFRTGFGDSLSSTAPVDGIYLTYSGNGDIVGRTRSNNSESSTATLTTLATSTWYQVRATVNSNATSVLFEVWNDAGTLLGSASLTTNIPTATGRELGFGSLATDSGGGTIDLVYMDYHSFYISGRTLARGVP